MLYRLPIVIPESQLLALKDVCHAWHCDSIDLLLAAFHVTFDNSTSKGRHFNQRLHSRLPESLRKMIGDAGRLPLKMAVEVRTENMRVEQAGPHYFSFRHENGWPESVGFSYSCNELKLAAPAKLRPVPTLDNRYGKFDAVLEVGEFSSHILIECFLPFDPAHIHFAGKLLSDYAAFIKKICQPAYHEISFAPSRDKCVEC